MIEATSTGVLLKVKVVPNASRTEIVGPYDDRLKIKVFSVPEKGKANKTVCDLLATVLGVSGYNVSIVHGETSPLKTVSVSGIKITAAKNKLGMK